MGFYFSFFFLNFWCYDLLNLHIPGEVSTLSSIFDFYVSLFVITPEQSFIQSTAKASPPPNSTLLHLLQQSKNSSFSLCHYRFILHYFNKYFSEFVSAYFNSLISVLFLLEIIFPSIIYYSYVCAYILSNAMIDGFRHEVERY